MAVAAGGWHGTKTYERAVNKMSKKTFIKQCEPQKKEQRKRRAPAQPRCRSTHTSPTMSETGSGRRRTPGPPTLSRGPSQPEIGSAADMSDWLIHILALGPHRTQDGIEDAVRKAHEKAARPFNIGLYRAALPQIIEQIGGTSGPYRLRPHLLMLARPDWPHYSQEQSNVLRAQKSGGDGRPAVVSQSSTPSLSGAHVPLIRSLEQYEAGKRKFEEDYGRYKQLDVELASHTSSFTELEHRINRASGLKAKEEAIAALLEAYNTHRDEIEAKARECRNLHLHLKRLKTAVNAFADEYNRRGG
eukprot:scaffold221425_cov32-Tisochrysis_lutea.AAC.3